LAASLNKIVLGFENHGFGAAWRGDAGCENPVLAVAPAGIFPFPAVEDPVLAVESAGCFPFPAVEDSPPPIEPIYVVRYQVQIQQIYISKLANRGTEIGTAEKQDYIPTHSR
jgi:hypothetical protein